MYIDTFDTMAVHGGTYASYWGAIGTDATISQTITANAGDQVVIDFWYAERRRLGRSLPVQLRRADAGGVHQRHGRTRRWTEMTFPVTVMNTNPVLMFSSHNNPAYDYIDDVSVCVTPGGPGACCAANGTCFASARRNPCTGGFFAGLDSDMHGRALPAHVVGACCNNATGGVLVRRLRLVPAADVLGRRNALLAQYLPDPGACCDDNAGTCSVATSGTCSGRTGRWFGVRD